MGPTKKIALLLVTTTSIGASVQFACAGEGASSGLVTLTRCLFIRSSIMSPDEQNLLFPPPVSIRDNSICSLDLFPISSQLP
jgi:hypothetical protein